MFTAYFHLLMILYVNQQGPQNLGTAKVMVVHQTLFCVRKKGQACETSIIPPSYSECKYTQQFTLQAVNNTAITTYGCKSLSLDLGLRRTFCWVFIIADVQNPILGADFLRNYSLLVDMKHSKLLDSLTQLRVQDVVSQESSPSPTFCNIHQLMNSKQSFQTFLMSLNHSMGTTHHTQCHSPYYNYWLASKCTSLTPLSREAKNRSPGV